jgi:hypothetical protein
MILKPGQCLIKSISLKTQKNKVINQDNNFLEFFGSLDIYQNMFNSFMTAELIILDGASFIERHNLSGNEDFEIEFEGYGRDEPMKYKFKIVEQVAISPVNNLRAKQVSFRLVSEEFLTDCSTSISKSYNVGTKEVVTDIVTSFLKSDKKIFVEDTKSIPVIIIPYLSPFKALDFLKQRTVSEKYKSSSFLFFENSNGFNFTTVEGVVDRESKKKIQEFFQSEAISQNIKSGGTSSDIDSNHLFFNYTVSSSFDLVSTFKNGGLKTNVTQYDLTTKKYQSRVFFNDPSTSIFIDNTSNKNPLVSDTVFQQYSQNNSKPLFIPFSKYKDTNNPTTNFIFDTVAERICFSSLFTQKRVYVDIPGNTLLEAGSVVNIRVARYDALNSKKELNEMESGLYLVTACKHSITNADSAKYDTHLELMRIGRGVLET